MKAPRLKAENSKDNNIEPCVVCTDSNVVQLFCLAAEQYVPSTKIVYVASAYIKAATKFTKTRKQK